MTAHWHRSSTSGAEPGWWFSYRIPVTVCVNTNGSAHVFTEHAQSADWPTHVAVDRDAAFRWAEAWHAGDVGA